MKEAIFWPSQRSPIHELMMPVCDARLGTTRKAGRLAVAGLRFFLAALLCKPGCASRTHQMWQVYVNTHRFCNSYS